MLCSCRLEPRALRLAEKWFWKGGGVTSAVICDEKKGSQCCRRQHQAQTTQTRQRPGELGLLRVPSKGLIRVLWGQREWSLGSGLGQECSGPRIVVLRVEPPIPAQLLHKIHVPLALASYRKPSWLHGPAVPSTERLWSCSTPFVFPGCQSLGSSQARPGRLPFLSLGPEGRSPVDGDFPSPPGAEAALLLRGGIRKRVLAPSGLGLAL